MSRYTFFLFRHMAFPKFIITRSGMLRLGMANQHRDLLERFDVCIGGGYYEFDYVSNCLLLSRQSYDFGKPQWSRLQTLIVPDVYRGMSIVYRYDDGTELKVSEALTIEYA